MKLAISNIAWTNEEEPEIAELLQSLGVKYVEIAPTKKWDEPIEVSDEEIVDYKNWWAGYGITIVAFQSMLFAHPEYTLFESSEERGVMLDYLKSFTELAGKMGVTRMVFGSPKNRQRKGMENKKALDIGTEFFTDIAKTASVNDVIFCIEPNATDYNCDFITTASQGLELVNKVNTPGFGLHLDIACMTLAGDDIAASIKKSSEQLKHFHVSSPMLGVVEDREDVDHRTAAQTLKEIKYDGYVSIEMRPGGTGTNIDRVRDAVLFTQNLYG